MLCPVFHYYSVSFTVLWCVTFTMMQLKRKGSDLISETTQLLPYDVTAAVFLSSTPPGCRSLVSEKCNVVPKSRGGLCARRLPLRGVSCPGHSPAAWFRSLAAENGLTGAAGHQLGYRVTHTQFHISPPMSYSVSLKIVPFEEHMHSLVFCCVEEA